jgi:ABC-type amino acid transport substrate-binding protein
MGFLRGRASARATAVAAFISLALLCAACGVDTPVPPEPTSPPTAIPTPVPTAAPVPTVGRTPVAQITATGNAEDDWSRIRKRGKLIAGTTGDYQPFAYYDASYRLVGFDIALITDLARRLGVQLEIQDYAFDGLPGALQLGQVDAVIAALSITPERSAGMDFTKPYYVEEDGILARMDFPQVTLGAVDDLVGRRIGVQRGSVFEAWLREALVNTGKIPAADLLVYAESIQAVRDMNSNHLDLVVLDLLPAQVIAAQEGVKLVGSGLNRQTLAIAVRKGSTSLRDALDGALNEARADGTLQRFVAEYMGLAPDQLAPTPTPPAEAAPQPSAVATPACVDGMALAQPLNLDDRDMASPPVLPAGQSFTKGWRLLNSGTCEWQETYTLAFVDDAQVSARMGGQDARLGRQVGVGQTVDVQLGLVAPIVPGVYQGFWQMRNAQGVAFGPRIHVGILVPSLPTLTPAPTAVPGPDIVFEADRERVRAGDRALLNWRVSGAQAVYFYAQGEPWSDRGVEATGSREVYPRQSTTYELRVVWPGARYEIRQRAIQVDAAGSAPVIASFVANPAYQLAAGQCAILQWSVQGTVSVVRLRENGRLVWDNMPLAGSYQGCPPNAGTVVYELEASGTGGTSRAQQVLNMLPSQATAQPTLAPGAPAVDAFTAQPSQITQGQCVQLVWSASGNTVGVRLVRNNTTLVDTGLLSGNAQDCPTDAGTLTYRAEAYSPTGQTATRTQAVRVSGP